MKAANGWKICPRIGESKSNWPSLLVALVSFSFETGEHERIIELLHTDKIGIALVQAVPDATIDIQNVASLLKRLELRGVDVGMVGR